MWTGGVDAALGEALAKKTQSTDGFVRFQHGSTLQITRTQV